MDGYGAIGSPNTGGSLPATGTDLLMYVLVAVVLIAVGTAIRIHAARKA